MKETEIKKIAEKFGADVFGISGMERFSDAPAGFSPRDIFPQCRSLVALGTALPKGVFKVDSRFIYTHYNASAVEYVDRCSFEVAKFIEREFGATAVPLPSDGPYEYWDKENLTGKGLISMKHAAVNAGIGRLGKSTLLLNRTFGNRLVVGAVLTDLELEQSPLAEEVCIAGCRKCMEGCPAGAIRKNQVNQKLCRPFSYGTTERGFDTVECNRCRALCPVAMGE